MTISSLCNYRSLSSLVNMCENYQCKYFDKQWDSSRIVQLDKSDLAQLARRTGSSTFSLCHRTCVKLSLKSFIMLHESATYVSHCRAGRDQLLCFFACTKNFAFIVSHTLCFVRLFLIFILLINIPSLKLLASTKKKWCSTCVVSSAPIRAPKK